MGYKNPAKRRACSRRWYYNHYEEELERIRARKKKLLRWYRRFKRTLRCADCNKKFVDCPEVCDFHHKKGKSQELKDYGMAGYLGSHGKEAFLKEVSKCVPLCANCHRSAHMK